MQAEADANGTVWSLCRDENRAGRQPVVPATVLAQVWRGDPEQVLVARVIKLCQVVDLDERAARRAGRLLGESSSSDVVDATVALVAMERGAAVVTSDPGDIHKIVDSVGGRVPLVTV
ncbi:PIN domain-containing protein [Nocardiopsis sp. HNM0947]|uniref:PIN domain-containing protein n=2 Tax=Nocardiopsis coralli TaxID=2772213 RepID=A0ABR9PAS5_9ACTN|nr:PIN domain-containing protein [Nocardiopsis coralli]